MKDLTELPPAVANSPVTHGELHELCQPLEMALVKLTSAALDLLSAQRSLGPNEKAIALGESAFEELKNVMEALNSYGDIKGRILLSKAGSKDE